MTARFEQLRVGDKIWRHGRLNVKHYGLCVGPQDRRGGPLVAHNSKDDLKVVVDDFSAFARGRPVFIERRAAEGFEQVVAQRALALEGSKYDLFNFNCEHFVNLVQEGNCHSPQVRGVVTAAVGVAGIMGLVKLLASASATTYDANACRYRDRTGRFVRG